MTLPMILPPKKSELIVIERQLPTAPRLRAASPPRVVRNAGFGMLTCLYVWLISDTIATKTDTPLAIFAFAALLAWGTTALGRAAIRCLAATLRYWR
jgi:hypothetical protein